MNFPITITMNRFDKLTIIEGSIQESDFYKSTDCKSSEWFGIANDLTEMVQIINGMNDENIL